MGFGEGDEESLRFLIDYYKSSEKWDELTVLFDEIKKTRLQHKHESEILSLLGRVHWREKSDPEKASLYFARLRKLNPSDPECLDFYRTISADSTDKSEFLSVLSDALRSVQGEERLVLAEEFARLAELLPATQERAIDAWKTVLKERPNHYEAKLALRKLYESLGRWNSLVELLREELESLSEDQVESQIALLRELVPIYRDKLGLDVMVIRTYTSILDLLPNDEQALQQLANIYESLRRWNDLVQVLERQAEVAESDEKKVALSMRVANIWVSQFANYNKATGPLERVLEIDPKHKGAVENLRNIYSKKRSWKSLHRILEIERDLSESPDEKLLKVRELAKLAGDRLHDNELALSSWKEVRRLDPSDRVAVAKIEKLSERLRDWKGLVSVLEEIVDEGGDSSEKVQQLQKLGSVYAQELGDFDKAKSTWRRILEIEPSNLRAQRTLREMCVKTRDWKTLEDIYESSGDWEGFVEVLGNAADQVAEPEVRVALSFRAAGIYEDKLSAPHRAVRNYERILSVEPQNERAIQALIPVYEHREKWHRVEDLLGRLLAVAESQNEIAEVVSLRKRLAVIFPR